ncbi:MAG TPA: AbrB/MazE/SpoVT family DNA-binding domain-containing protein [Candidatus Nanoarchaeia archaeon]|nr:AbrB/MazE/SpoVT family DNA-binding domain-containing protein [Candidatus Nanoarchaeia archaeon]
MIETIKVSSKGQIVIPESLRNELGIEEGTKLVIIEKDNQMIIEKEEIFLKKLNSQNQERIGWLALAEQSLNKLWDNEKDEKTWSKYI